VLDLDHWREILDTIRHNKLRTLLTGFSVAWGVFMLIVLLGSGEGLRQGFEYQFRDDAMNSIWVFAGQTSVPWLGLKPGRGIQLTNLDHDEVEQEVPGVEHITSRFFIRGRVTVVYRGETGTFDVRAVHPDHRYLEKTIITAGRFLNQLDLAEYRKTAVIGDLVQKALFHGESPLGKLIAINGVAFQVVGVFEDEGNQNEREKIYLPITTAQRTFSGGNQIRMFMLTTGEAGVAEADRMAGDIRGRLAARHRFSTEDKRAVFVRNNVEEYERFRTLLRGMRGFIWVIGAGTLLAGVVSVSNIMMITVRDRTREIGIRKALGATPRSLLGLILQEAVVITGVSGYFGLVAGLAALEFGSRHLPASDYFKNPAVDLEVALWATALLVLAGVLAGLFPARKAARIRPIDALRFE
jgi:putative ABC transport system permease protein